MSEVKRYCMDQTGCEIEDPAGVWVRADDYERDVQRAIAAGIRMQDKCAALEAENERLRDELAALKAVPDGVEVVAWLFPNPDGTFCMDAVRHDPEYPGAQPVMTVAQHNAIVSALRQPVADEREAFEEFCKSIGYTIKTGDSGRYLGHYGAVLWTGWKARAALSAPAAGADVSAREKTVRHALEAAHSAIVYRGKSTPHHYALVELTKALQLTHPKEPDDE